MTKTVNWGILGPGKIAEKFAQGLKFVPNAKLLAVGSRSAENANEFAKKHGVSRAYSSYEKLVTDPEIDVVYIATPHIFHCEHSLLCLENEKAVLCEKPFAMNEKEVNSMISKAHEKNVFLMEALWTRFLPTILKTLEIIKDGTIGDVIHIKSDFGFKPPFDPMSRLFNRDLGGGSLLDIGIYPVFIALLLLGEPYEIKASAFLGKTGVDENLSIIFNYKNGQFATLFSTLLAETSVETDICGTKGRIRINRMWHIPTTISLTLNNGTSETIEFDCKGNGYEFEAIEVTNCLIHGLKQSPSMTHDFSLKLIKTLDKIRNMCGIKYSAD